MAELERPLLIVSDIHLGAEARGGVSRDLARLIEAHTGHELVLAGDAFDLSFAPEKARSGELLARVLQQASDVVRAMRRHVAGGGAITLIPGNHDAALGEPPVMDVLRSRLAAPSEAPLMCHPWFVRRGDLHIEHGHVYDPDNAPFHPLVAWEDRTEPLGVALTRRFVAYTGANDFSHAQDTTPVEALTRAFRLYGRRAPWMIASYFRTAMELCLEGGSRLTTMVGRERAEGAERLDSFARASGVPTMTLHEVLAGTPEPTHLSRRDLLLRLYFDRVFASLLLAGALTALPRRPSALPIALASFAYLAASVLRRKDRYGSLPQARLRDGAERVRDVTGARLVIFGHTHHEERADGYLNAGSFAFSRGPGRPYIMVERRGSAELRRLEA